MTHPIIVTGPQRAGSRLASHIISRDSGRLFIDELDYSIDIPNNSVVQAPLLLKILLEVSFIFPTAQFAFMYRSKSDIIKSMERIEWYKDYINEPSFYSDYIDHCYALIDSAKAYLPKHRWFDIQYKSLMNDPLFTHNRADFTVKQHLPNTPNGPRTWRNDDYIRST